jgi:hypothetical protein
VTAAAAAYSQLRLYDCASVGKLSIIALAGAFRVGWRVAVGEAVGEAVTASVVGDEAAREVRIAVEVAVAVEVAEVLDEVSAAVGVAVTTEEPDRVLETGVLVLLCPEAYAA